MRGKRVSSYKRIRPPQLQSFLQENRNFWIGKNTKLDEERFFRKETNVFIRLNSISNKTGEPKICWSC